MVVTGHFSTAKWSTCSISRYVSGTGRHGCLEWGGEHFVFFQPVFNVADAALSVSVIVLILFYSRHLVMDRNETSATEESTSEETPTDKE